VSSLHTSPFVYVDIDLISLLTSPKKDTKNTQYVHAKIAPQAQRKKPKFEKGDGDDHLECEDKGDQIVRK